MRRTILRPTALWASVAIACAVAVGLVAPASQAADSLPEDTYAERVVAYEAAREKGQAQSAARIAELRAQGLTADKAETQLNAEMEQVAKPIVDEAARLAVVEGATTEQIAEKLDLVVIPESPENPRVDNVGVMGEDDMTLSAPTKTYSSICDCTIVNSSWNQGSDLLSGTDAVAIRFTETIFALYGTAYYTDIGTDPDTHRSEPMDEDPQGFATTFSSEQGERGRMYVAVRQYIDAPGFCQSFAHYRHAWTTVKFTGFSISTSGFGISWTFDDGSWHNSRGSNYGVAC